MKRGLTGLCILMVSLEGLNQFWLRNLFTVIITFSFFIISDQDSGVGIIDSVNAASREMFSFDRANAQI